jgi:hypothetical protein
MRSRVGEPTLAPQGNAAPNAPGTIRAPGELRLGEDGLMAEPEHAPDSAPDPYAGRHLTAAQLRGREDVRPWLVQILRFVAIAIILGFTLVTGWVTHVAVVAMVFVAVAELVVLVFLVRSVISLIRIQRG